MIQWSYGSTTFQLYHSRSFICHCSVCPSIYRFWLPFWYLQTIHIIIRGPSWSWSYGTRIYNYICNQNLSQWNCEFKTRSWWSVLDTTLRNQIFYLSWKFSQHKIYFVRICLFLLFSIVCLFLLGEQDITVIIVTSITRRST
jgi:hypothetical protein